jgi:RNA polymerase sigma-70 factor (ECF subfamily)
MGRSADKPSLDRLVAAHLSEAMRLAIRLTGDPQEAEEVVQEALLRVARGWKSFRRQARFRTWLFRIVINAFRDRLRARPATESLPEDVPDARAADPPAEAAAAELGRLVAARVSALPPRQREVLILTAYEGLAPPEVAKIVGISRANVHATLHAARRRLRKELAPHLATVPGPQPNKASTTSAQAEQKSGRKNPRQGNIN